MAFLSANRSFQSLHGQFRFLVISSWVKNRRRLSGPVRYIPGEHVKITKRAKFSQIKSAEEKESDPIVTGAPGMSKFEGNFSHNSHFDSEDLILSNIFDRNEKLLEFEDSSSYAPEIMETSGEDNLELSHDEAQDIDVTKITESEKVMENTIKQDAEKMAINLLAARAFTTLELQKKLRGKKYSRDIVDAVVVSMKDRGLLNDGLYAETFSHSRWLSSTWGPRRIKMALSRKGVSESVSERATRQVFQEDEAGSESQNTQHGISKPAFERLYLEATKQWLRSHNTAPENRKARVVRWLQYRGFSWGVTGIILRKLASDHPA